MNQLAYNTPPNSAFKKDWNEYQHLCTQGRYIQPRLFSGFQNQRIKLTTVKRQLYQPKVPTIRRIERDEILCRLPDEHSRHTSLFTEEQFQNFDPKREESFMEFSGLNWHNTGKALLGIHSSSFNQYDSSLEFGARLRPDKSLIDSRIKFFQSPSSFSMSSSTKRNNKFVPRNIFRSSSMYADVPTLRSNSDGIKSSRI